MATPVLISSLPRNGTARDGGPGRPSQDGKSGRPKLWIGFDTESTDAQNISNARGHVMTTEKLGSLELDLTMEIEELEQKIAPDGGETVLPLPLPKKGKR